MPENPGELDAATGPASELKTWETPQLRKLDAFSAEAAVGGASDGGFDNS